MAHVWLHMLIWLFLIDGSRIAAHSFFRGNLLRSVVIFSVCPWLDLNHPTLDNDRFDPIVCEKLACYTVVGYIRAVFLIPEMLKSDLGTAMESSSVYDVGFISESSRKVLWANPMTKPMVNCIKCVVNSA